MLTVPYNHPYIGVVAGDATVQFFVIAERNVLVRSKSFQSSLKSLIAAYYAFGICYPTATKAPLIFIQHFLLNIKEVKLPDNIIRFVSSIDSLT